MAFQKKQKTVNLPLNRKFNRYEFGNKMELVVIEDTSHPIVTSQFWYQVGSAHEKVDSKINRTGLAHFFEHLMYRGTRNHPDGEFDRILSENGAYDSNATTWLDRTHYYLSLPKEKLETILKLEADRMENLILNEEVFEAERGAVLGELRIGLDDPETVGYDKLYLTAFDRHPYRYGTMGTEEEIKSFTLDDARYFYETYYSPVNLSLWIVGDVNPDEVAERVDEHFKMIHKALPQKPPQAQEEKTPLGIRRAEFKHPQIVEPVLFLGYRVPGVAHKDQAGLWILQTLLTEGNSALLNKVWIDSGLAHDIEGGLDQFRDSGLLTLAADLNRGVNDLDLLHTLDRGLMFLLSAPDLEEKVSKAKNQILQSVFEGFDDIGQFASWMGEYWVSSGNHMRGFELLHEVKNFSHDDLAHVIHEYLTPENRTEILGLSGEAS